MSGYRRFITYLFWYENNDKKTNCGFAKVEQRQNAGRIEVHIKNCPGERENIKVYFFTKEGTKLPMILLGEMPLKKGTADALFKFECNAVGDSVYSLDQIRGIVIPLKAGLLVASLWDDEAYDWSQLTEKTDFPDHGEEAQDAENDLNSVAMKSEKPGSDLKNLVMDEIKTEHGADEPVSDIVSEGNRPVAEIEVSEETGAEDVGASAFDTGAASDLKIQSVPLPAQAADQSYTGWKQIEGLYPKVYPFYGDKNVWGVQAQLRDIKYLPQKFWPLGNNSFLLHGYFNYGTILMGYMENEKRYFIGVPGIFQNQERVLASLFGFPEFRTQQQCIQKTGEFGYWYRFLDF